MKEELKNVLLMGLGAISLTGEKAMELKKELLEKGENLYKEGMIKNEELKRDLKEKIKENVTVEVAPTTKEELTFRSIPDKIGSWKILENVEIK